MKQRPLAIRLAAVACLCLSCATAVMLARFAVTGLGTSWVAAGAVLSMAALLAGMTLSQGGRRALGRPRTP